MPIHQHDIFVMFLIQIQLPYSSVVLGTSSKWNFIVRALNGLLNIDGPLQDGGRKEMNELKLLIKSWRQWLYAKLMVKYDKNEVNGQ